MANASAWSSQLPSGSSQIRQSDNQFRSHQSILEATLNEEHYFASTASNTSAGQHQLGSARVFSGAVSSVSTRADTGRLMWTTDARQLFHVGHGSIDTIPSIGTINEWLSRQSFSGGLSLGTDPRMQVVSIRSAKLVISDDISIAGGSGSLNTYTSSSDVTRGDVLTVGYATLTGHLHATASVSDATANTIDVLFSNPTPSLRTLTAQTVTILITRIA